jgi:hypothetical protein
MPEDITAIGWSSVNPRSANSGVSSQPAPKESTQKPISYKNPAAVALGKLGGKKGGDARAKKLSPELDFIHFLRTGEP